MTERFTGVHWMMATPFDQDHREDFESVFRLVEKAQESGCQGVVTLGVTGAPGSPIKNATLSSARFSAPGQQSEPGIPS